MRNELSAEQLAQEVTVSLPLGTVLRLAEDRETVTVTEAAGAPADFAARMAYLKSHRPDIGTKGLYGIYAGNVRADRGEPDGILEVLDEAPEAMTWSDAMKWAESTGGRLPTRREQAVLFGNVPELFQKAWYWSCEQYEPDPDYAWVQYFDGGNQFNDRKGNLSRARAVRRLPIE